MVIPDFTTTFDILKKGATLEAQEMIMNLREKFQKLREENFDLREENQKLRNQLISQMTLVYEAPYYWRNEGERKDGPFCQQCYDSAKEQIRLQHHDGYGEGAWECKNCKSDFKDKNYDRTPRSHVF